MPQRGKPAQGDITRVVETSSGNGLGDGMNLRARRRSMVRGRRRAALNRRAGLRNLGYVLSPVPALAVQGTYLLYSLNTLFTIEPGPVPDGFESRFDAPGGIPFYLPWTGLIPSVAFAAVAIVGMVREERSRIREHRPFFLGFVWGLGAIYTYGYGVGFIVMTPTGNGMLLVSGCLGVCSIVSLVVAFVKLAMHHLSGRATSASDHTAPTVAEGTPGQYVQLDSGAARTHKADMACGSGDES